VPHFDLLGGIGRLQKASARLKEHWLETKAHWNDQASRDFEKSCLQPLPPQITLTVAAVHKLADVLQQALIELEDRQE
jgi:hypothetical protein